VFVDWLHDKSADFWKAGLDDLYELVNYDGLWLDMSEPTSFANGETDTGIKKPAEKRVLASEEVEQGLGYDNSWFVSYSSNNADDTYYLPFVVVGSDPNKSNWDNMTISLNATHPGLNNELEYNLHSLYGHMMAWRTNNYLSAKSDNRPFILTRSTFASSGRFTSHWLGDNWRDWKYMRYSISGMMNMNMFGIPHVGADVCGFFGEKRDDEMCLRWI
jgi:alpha-glucosidase (family GH31 glycosyl hydrolase)